jgi:Protein of unknown function (DUF1553)/Protein of unknown function (DUF1549)/Planctomycete cytochrome C
MTGLALLRLLPLLGFLLIAIPNRPPGEETGAIGPAPRPKDDQVEFFEKQVRPLLAGRCFKCHSADANRIRGNFRLDTHAGLLKGGVLGPAVVPGDPDQSPLIRAVRYEDPELKMPPDRRLTRREIEVLESWVKSGAPGPREEPVAAVEKARSSKEVTSWWSFQPIRWSDVPSVRDEGWPRNWVDRFILGRLEAAGMRPAPEANPRALLRRLTFDLTGLPPTPDEVEAFLNDDAPDAYGRAVNRLLASPHHGERWGRHWLDLVRYADTSGCNGDFPMPEAYRYRNYVVESFNRDKPYNVFLQEQIAGDLQPAGSEEERRERIVATGYLAISRRFSSVAEEFHLTLDDTVDNIGKAMLGLSISCARCHDHKFDPISQKDYYALYGIFQSTRYAFPGTEIYRHAEDLVPLVSAGRRDGELRPFLERMAKLDREIHDTYAPVETLDTGKAKDDLREKVKKLQAERDELLRTMPAFDRAYAVSEGEPADTRIQIKGDPAKLGPAVLRGFLTILGGQRLPNNETGSGRRALAGWLTDPSNPLTARVLVNRVWQHHFGQGLVRTPNDFGTRGEPPTHPELLDALTKRFVDEGWSIKKLHREIVLSATYRMASVEEAESARKDPENRLLWTFNRRRLDAEEIRDAVLAVSGTLDRSPRGPHPFPPEWKWRYTQHNPFVDDYPSLRRGIYLMQSRIRLQPFLAVFDGADTNASTDQRKPSATPQQALFTLNDQFVHEQAGRLADRLAAEAGDPSARVDRAFRLAFARPPSEAEAKEARDYIARIDGPLKAAGIADGKRSRAAWSSYLRVLLGSNEFVFVD